MNTESAILLATYNGEKYLAEQLNSLLTQTYNDFVVYIHDDNSTDNTISIIDQFCLKYPKKFKHLKYESNHGPIANFMSLVDYANKTIDSKYFCFCDQDDVWLPNKIDEEIKLIKKIERVYPRKPVLVYCDQKLTDKNLKIFATSSMKYAHRNAASRFNDLVFENSAPGCTQCINKRLLSLCSLYKDRDDIIMHDWLAILIASIHGKVEYLDLPLMLYRQHETNVIGAVSGNNLRKFINFTKNIKSNLISKNEKVKKAEKQANMVLQEKRYGNNKEVNDFVSACKEIKIKRIIFFLRYKYIKLNKVYLIFFV